MGGGRTCGVKELTRAKFTEVQTQPRVPRLCVL